MLEKLKITLRKITQSREADLEEYQKEIAGVRPVYFTFQERPIESWNRTKEQHQKFLIQQRRTHLVLDFPQSKCFCGSASYIPRCQIEGWNEQIRKWCNIGSKSTRRVKTSVIDLLEQADFLSLDSRKSKRFAEDWLLNSTLEKMFEAVESAPLCISSKSTYRSYVKDLWKFIGRDWMNLLSTPIPYWMDSSAPPPIDLYEIARLFEYLESRALKSATIRAFADIVLCRSLMYAPLPAKKFFKLRPPDEKQFCLRYNDNLFPVPNSFMELWACMGYSDHLFPPKWEGWDERALHKKISRLGQYAQISPSLTPSALRHLFVLYRWAALDL